MNLYILQNDIGVPEGYYSNDKLAVLLRQNRRKPKVIQFIGDMIEDGCDKKEHPKNYIRCFDCESKIIVGYEFFTEEREKDGVEIPYCPKCYGRTLEPDDPFITNFWENHSSWADNN